MLQYPMKTKHLEILAFLVSRFAVSALKRPFPQGRAGVMVVGLHTRAVSSKGKDKVIGAVEVYFITVRILHFGILLTRCFNTKGFQDSKNSHRPNSSNKEGPKRRLSDETAEFTELGTTGRKGFCFRR